MNVMPIPKAFGEMSGIVTDTIWTRRTARHDLQHEAGIGICHVENC